MLFGDLPPVLQLQLKRFEYDFQRDAMIKVWGRWLMDEQSVGVFFMGRINK